MAELPSGTITFLFTDIEGSTRLWEQHPEAVPMALARHDLLVREAIGACAGHVFKTVGGQLGAAFATVPDALTAIPETIALLILRKYTIRGIPLTGWAGREPMIRAAVFLSPITHRVTAERGPRAAAKE